MKWPQRGDLLHVNSQPPSESDLQLELLRKKIVLRQLLMRNKLLKHR